MKMPMSCYVVVNKTASAAMTLAIVMYVVYEWK